MKIKYCSLNSIVVLHNSYITIFYFTPYSMWVHLLYLLFFRYIDTLLKLQQSTNTRHM